MNKVISNARVTELDGLSDTIVRLYKDDSVAASGSKGASATSLKKPLLSTINEKLVPYLTAMQISKNAECAAFASTVEAEIARLNEAVAKRSKKGGTAESTPPHE